MTTSPEQPTGKGPEANPPDPKTVTSELGAMLMLDGMKGTAGHPTHSDSAANPAPHAPVKAADDRTASGAFVSGVTGQFTGTLDGTATMMGGKAHTDQELANMREHRTASDDGGSTVVALFNMAKGLVTHPGAIASGLADAGARAIDTLKHGTTNEKMELLGASVFTIGTLVAGPAAGGVAKLGSERSALGMAEQGLTEATAARTSVAIYREGADAALAEAEERAAAVASQKALVSAVRPAISAAGDAALAIKPVAAVEAAAPVSTTVDIGSKLRLPALEPSETSLATRLPALDAPTTSLASRLTGRVTAPFKSLFGTSEAAAGESATSKFANIFKDEKRVGSLPTHLKVDGLRTGEVTLPGAGTGERVNLAELAGKRITAPVERIEPGADLIKVPGSHAGATVDPIEVPAARVRPTDEQVQAPATGVRPTDEPVQAPAARVRPTDQPVPSSTSMFRPTDEPGQAPATRVRPTDEQVQAPAARVRPTDEPVQAPAARVKATDEPLPARAANVRETGEPVHTPASRVESPASRVESPASRVESPASRVESPASHVESPADAIDAQGAHSGASVQHVEVPAGSVRPTGELGQAPAARIERSTEPVAGSKVHVEPAAEPIKVQAAQGATARVVPAAIDPIAAEGEEARQIVHARPPIDNTPVAGRDLVEPQPFSPVPGKVGPQATHVEPAFETRPALGTDAVSGNEVGNAVRSNETATAGRATEVGTTAGSTVVPDPVARPIEVSNAPTPNDAANGQLQIHRPAATVAVPPSVEAAATIAGKAGDDLENFSRITSEKGLALSPEAQRGLTELSTQLKAVSQGAEGSLSLDARAQMSKNIEAVEQSLATSGADASVNRQFSELKASINDFAPSNLASAAHVAEAPVAIAARAGENIQSFTQLMGEKGLTLSPDAQRGLTELNAQIKAVSQGEGAALSLEARAQMSRNLATVEQSLATSGADASVTGQFSELKASVDDFAQPTVAAVAPVAAPPVAIAARAGENVQSFTQLVSDKGLTLSPDAQRGLTELNAQIKAVSQGEGGALSLEARAQMSRNLATVEQSLATSGADASVTRQFSALKASVDDFAPPAVAQVAPAAEAPVAIAARASENVQSFTQLVSDKGLTLSPDAQRGLTELNAQMKAVSESAEGALSLEARTQMSRNIATVEESLTASGADANVTRQFSKLKASVNDLAPPAVAPLAPVEEVPAALAVDPVTDAPVAPAVARVTEVPVALAPVAPTAEVPAALAARAGENVQSFTQLASEKGLALSPDAQAGLSQLSTQLKTISEGAGDSLSLEARAQMSKNIATVEESLAASGADSNVARQFSDLKASINELAPATAGPIAPLTEAPAAIAARAGENIDSFTQFATEKGLKLSPDAEESLQNISAQINSAAGSNAVPLTSQASAQMAQDLTTVERSLTASGADASIVKQFGQVKATVSDLTAAVVEREQIAGLYDSLKTLDRQGAELSAGVKTFKTISDQLGDLPALSAADQRVAATLSNRLEAIDVQLAQGGLTEAPLATTSDVQQFVREFDRPEYSRFFANNPDAARAFEEVKASTSAVAATTSKVESAQIGISGVRQAEIFQQNVENLAVMSRDMQAAFQGAAADQPVATALKGIENDLATIKSGANPEAVFRNVQDKIEKIEGAGAGNLAGSLKQKLGDLETTNTSLERARSLESNIAIIRDEGTSIEAQSATLSQQFGEDAITAPSTTSMVPNNTQISEQLQLISRQAKLLDASESGAAAVTKIKDAFTKVEDLTAQGTLTADQAAALQDMRASIARIDQATVEATGLRTLEENAAQITRQTTQVETLAAGIAKSADLSTPGAIEAQAEQKLNSITRAAQDVRAAGTLDEQVNAVNNLATTVQDPELQAYLSRSQAGLKSLEDLKAATAELHESVSYRALERSQAIASAEAENAVNASRAVEARIQNDVALANSQSVQVAATEYRAAAEGYATASDKVLAAAQMDQKLDALQVQLSNAARNTAVSQSEEMVALQRAQSALNQSVSDSELMARSLIDRRLPVIENGFDQIGIAQSTVVQRELMRNMSSQIQDLRYLEGSAGGSSDQLAQAQMQLTRAQNDLEVATYRSNMLKLAANGDKAATDKLLISGLTSDGYKANTMLTSSGPAARLVEDFAKSRAFVQGLLRQPSEAVRSLAASDPLLVNNPGVLSMSAARNAATALRYTGYTLMGVGAGTAIGAAPGAYRDYEEGKARAADQSASAAARPQSVVQPGQSGQAGIAPISPATGRLDAAEAQALSAQRAQTDNLNSGALATGNTAADGRVTNLSGTISATGSAVAPDNRVIGRSAGDARGFSPNGQALARGAFSQDLANQAVPHTAKVVGTIGGAGDIIQPSLSLLPADNLSLFRSVAVQAGSFIVYNDDVNRDAELYRIMALGTQFLGSKYGGDPVPEAVLVAPFTLAQTLHIGGGGHGAAKGLEKPATSQFVLPVTSLSSPFALGAGVAAKRDVLTARFGGSVFGGAAGATARGVDSGLRLASLTEADAEEGEDHAGMKHLKGVESTESHGIDSNAGHAGGVTAAATSQQGGNNDEEGAGATDPDPTVTVAAHSPVAGTAGAGAASPSTAAANDPATDPATGRRVPPATKAEQPVAVAQADEQNSGPTPGTPPRRRAPKDAISA